jgi:hypothetical protein
MIPSQNCDRSMFWNDRFRETNVGAGPTAKRALHAMEPKSGLEI